MINKKSSVAIMLTTDYSKFKFLEGNRVLEESIVQKIIDEIEGGTDLSEYKPVLVDKRFNVIDGQHMFTALQRLGKPIPYVVLPKEKVDLLMIARLNSAQGAWKVKNYLHLHVKSNNAPYRELKQYCEKLDIPVTVGINVLSGRYSKNTFEEGKFRVRASRKAISDVFAELINELKPKYPYVNTKSFAQALLQMIQNPNFSKARLLKKIEEVKFIRKSGSMSEYMRQLEGSYNYHAKKKIRFFN